MAETLRELVVALSLDSSNFARNMRTINLQIKEAESTFKLAGAGVDNFEKSIAGTEAKLSMLGSKLQNQNRAVEQYSRALVQANQKLTDSHARQERLTQSLEAARTAMANARDQVDQARATYDQYRRTLGDADSATIAARANLDLAQQEYQECADRVRLLEGQLKSNSKTMQNNADAISKTTANLNNAKAGVRETEAEIQKLTRQLYIMQSKWTQAGQALEAFAKKCDKISKVMVSTGKSLTKTVTTPIVALGASAIKASMDYEYAFADVRKTVDATEEEYAELSRSVKQMSTEVAASSEDIAKVMSIAGQLGIENEHLSEFTRIMIDLGNSTNMVAEDAASDAARFANIMGMHQDQFQNLGSTLVDLGNNYATTEAEIMAMSMRLAGAGKQVGLSEAQVLGFAAALSSVGIQAQMGGSAFSKALIKMEVAAETGGEALDDFAKVAGMTSEQFKELWKSDPAAAFQSFIVGLAKLDDEGASAIKTLDDIGISEIRLRDTLLRATNATELFSKTQATANKAWKENTALATEANKRYATTKARLTNLKNTAILFTQQIGDDMNPTIQNLIDKANELLGKFMGMDEAQRKAIIKFAAFAAAAGPAILILGKIVGAVGKVSSVMGTVATGIGKFSGAVKLAGGGIGGFLKAALSSKLVIAALAAAVIYGAYKWVDYASGAKAAREALEGMEKTARSWKETAAETFYGKSQGLGAFGLSREDFVRTTASSREWMTGLLAIWSDGKQETDEIIREWTDSWGAITGSTREALKEMQTTADQAGYSSVSTQLQADIDTLDSMDAEIAKLLKRAQNRKLSEKEKVRLQELVDAREAIEVKYHLTAADTDGFETIRKKVEAEVARAEARGQEVSATVYEDAMVAAGEGMASVNSAIDAQYDKEYAVVQLIEDSAQRQAAMEQLNAKYNEQRRAAALEYAQLMADVAMPVWEQADIQEAKTQVGDLAQLLRQYSAAASDAEKQSFLPKLNELTSQMDEGALTEYVSLLTQIQSLLDSGMSEAEVQSMFPDIDFSGALDQLAAIQTYLNTNKWDPNLTSLNEMFGTAIGEEVLKIATDLDMTGAQARWEEWAANPGAITTDAVIESYTEGENATKVQPKVDALISKYTEIPEGADTAALTPTGIVAFVNAYAEATTGASITGLTPSNVTALVGAYREMAAGADISSLSPEEIVAYVTKYAEGKQIDISGLSPEGIVAFVSAYQEIAAGAAVGTLSPTGLIAYVSKYAEITNGADVSGLTPSNVTAMVSAYKELASGTDVTALKPSEITAYVMKYLEGQGVDTSKLSPSAVTAFVLAYEEITGGASTGKLTPTGITAYVKSYAETTGADVSALNPTNVTAMVSAYKELATGTDISTLKPSQITAYISKYLENEGVDTTGLTPAAITAFVSAYQEIEGGASVGALNPAGVAALVASYAEAEGVDLSKLNPSQIEAMVSSFAEATGCDKSKLLQSFTAYITEYKEAAGVKKPTLNLQIGLAGYDLLAYRRWLKANPVEVQGIVRLSEVYEDPKTALSEEGVKFWKNGEEIPVTAVTEDMLKPDDVAVLDDDGTMHILITAEVSGAPEAIADLREQVAEVDKLGVTSWGKAAGILPATLMDYISAAEKRIQTYKNPGFFDFAWLSDLIDASGRLKVLDQSMQTDFNADNIAELSTYVAEVVAAIQNGSAVSEEDMANLQKILQFVQDLDSVGVGGNVTEGIAEGMTEAGWDTSAETVAENLEAAINAALVINSPSERMKPAGEYVAAGIGEGMSGYDYTASAQATASAIESAVAASLTIDTLKALGTTAASGVAEALTSYSMTAAGSALGSNVKTAVSSSLNASSLRAIGVSAMSGLIAGINAGRSGVISAMRAAARAAVSAAKSELKIASPSKVFEEEVGVMTMKGLGEGVTKETKAQAKIIRNAARFLTVEAREGSIAYNTNDNRRTITQTSSVNLSGNNFYVRDETDIRSLAVEIATLTRRQQHGKGLRFA